MHKIIFFDTETTGNTNEDFLIQLAYKSGEEKFENLYKPPIKIPPDASAIHHITNKMVADSPTFKDSKEYTNVKDLFENENSVVVAHNALFDLEVIKKENIEPKKFICTLRLSRYLDPEEKIEKYNLQYLRYLLDLDVEATAHDAMGDVLVLEKLFERLKTKMMTENGEDEDKVIEKMIEISSHPSLFHSFKFGKYNGQKIEDVVKTDRGYLQWLYDQKKNGDTIEEDWIYTLKHYLEK
ncbi:MAG: exonuclease domain-containing protein [Patescibacteria group bacterium]|mgnify:CR=1 FL=1